MVQNNPTRRRRNLIFIEDRRRRCRQYSSWRPEKSLVQTELIAATCRVSRQQRQWEKRLAGTQAWWCLGVLCPTSSRCAFPEPVGTTACVLGSSQLQRGHQSVALCFHTYRLTPSPWYWAPCFLDPARGASVTPSIDLSPRMRMCGPCPVFLQTGPGDCTVRD